MLSSMVRGTFQMWFRTMRWGDDPNHESLEVGWGKRRVGTEIWFWEGLRPIIHGFEEPRKAAAFRSWECPLAYSQQTTETAVLPLQKTNSVKQESDSPLEPPEGNAGCQYLALTSSSFLIVLFYYWRHRMWDLSSPTRDWTHVLGSESMES